MVLIDNMDDLLVKIRAIVREEVARSADRPLTRKEIAAMFGVHVNTVDKMVRRGDLKRINPHGGHPRFSMNEVISKLK